MATTLARFVCVLVTAILAGVSIGIWVGFNPMGLSTATYVEQQQNMLGHLRVLMVVLVVFATFLSVVLAVLQRFDRPVFWSLVAASACLASCILITAIGNRPIDEIVLTWAPTSVPDDWTKLRDRWWTLHILRTVAEATALVLVTWASISKQSPTRPVERASNAAA
jgi:hypothetical protein